MKSLIAAIILLGTTAAFAKDKVKIEITANSEELCRLAAKRLVETSRDLEEKDLDIVEITNCNKSLSGKWVKKVNYQNVIDYNH